MPKDPPTIVGPDGLPLMPDGAAGPGVVIEEIVNTLRMIRHSTDMAYCMAVVKMPSPWKRLHAAMVANAEAVLDDAEHAAEEFNRYAEREVDLDVDAAIDDDLDAREAAARAAGNEDEANALAKEQLDRAVARNEEGDELKARRTEYNEAADRG